MYKLTTIDKDSHVYRAAYNKRYVGCITKNTVHTFQVGKTGETERITTTCESVDTAKKWLREYCENAVRSGIGWVK